MNAIVREFETRLKTIQAWRHHIHQHPELSFEEVNTAKYIADLVRSWGYEVVERIGKLGVVASMTAGDGTKAIGLCNAGEFPAEVNARWSDLGLNGKQLLRHVWRQKDIGTFEGEFKSRVPRRGVVLIRATSIK